MRVGPRASAPLIRRLLTFLAVVGLLSPILLVAPAARADDATPAAPAPAGLSDFGACLAGRGKGSMIILIDQSGSLRSSDPEGARVTAAQ